MDNKIFSVQLISALVSAGVSLLISIICFFGGKIYSCYRRHKEFKIYKKYLIEFLENYLYFLEKKRFKYYEKEYEMDSLNIVYYPNFDRIEKIISISFAPFIILSFFKENKILSNEESGILSDILIQISEHSKIFVLDYPVIEVYNDDNETTDNKIIKHFSRFEIISISPENNILASGLQNEHILTIDEDEMSLGNKVKTILKELKESKDKKHDIRIKKIINKKYYK